MNQYHSEILQKIRSASHPGKIDCLPDNYSGSSHPDFYVKTSDARKIAKNWAKNHVDLPIGELVETLNALSRGESIDEKAMVGKILGYLPERRREIDPKLLDYWLKTYVGWGEIDSLCQSNFTEKDLLSNWPEWEKLLRQLSRDSNISKRRASLVLLTYPVSHSADERLAGLAFENIDKLKTEKDILITKAISWLLRSLIFNHREKVEQYVAANAHTLPKIAIRETRNKLLVYGRY